MEGEEAVKIINAKIREKWIKVVRNLKDYRNGCLTNGDMKI